MDSQAGTFAKVTPPTLSHAIRRRRLFQLLDEEPDTPAVWVAGPPGCGKTVLLRSYVEHLGWRFLWYQVDAGDADPASFFYYLGLAGQKAVPSSRKPYPLLSPEYFPGLSVFAMRFFETLFNRLDQPAALVFDNYQDVAQDAPVHELLRQGIQRFPDHVRIFLVSRSHPPPAMARLRANNRMRSIQWEDLRLTFEEACEIADRRIGGRIDRQTLRQLHADTDGWAAGLSLMLEAAASEPMALHSSNGELTEAVFDYFAGEVFHRSPGELQDFLLRTAFFPEFSLAMARDVTGNARSRSLLAALCRSNYFITRHLHRTTYYRYHSLFRSFLVARAEEQLPAAVLMDLRQQTAQLLERAGRIDAAAEMWLAAEKWDAVTRIVVQQGKTLLTQGRFQMVDSWIERLPRERVDGNPWLLLFESYCRLAVDPHEAEKKAEQAYRLFKKQDDGMGRLLAWSAIVESIIFAWGNHTPLDIWIDEFFTFVDTYETLPIQEVKSRTAINLFAALTFRRPHHPDIEAWADKALALCDALNVSDEQIRIRFQLVWHHILHSGKLLESKIHFDEIHQLVRKPSVSPLVRIMVHWIECIYFTFTAQYQQAIAAADRGLELSKKTGITFFSLALHGILIQCYLDSGDTHAAARQLKILERGGIQIGFWFQLMLIQYKTRLLMMRKKFQKARPLVAQGIKLSSLSGSWFGSLVISSHKLYLLCMTGKLQPALAYLDKAFLEAEKWKSYHAKTIFLLHRANISLALGNDRAAMEALEAALERARKVGIIFSFVDLPANTAELMAKAIESGIEADYAREIVRKRRLLPEKPPIHLEAWPWPLKIITLNRFSLLKEDEALPFGRKMPRKPLALLKLLVTLGGKAITETRIADALWPDADGDRAQQSLKTNLHRLRKLLGHGQALIRKNRCITLDRRIVWSDLWAFEAMYETISAFRKDHPVDEARTAWVLHCKRALDLYGGPFLGDEAWSAELIAKREQIRGRFHRIAEALGRDREQSGQWEAAADLYERMLDKYEAAEVFYGRLMHCYHRLGRRRDALAVYERCKAMALHSLAMKPSLEIENLYRFLQNEK